MAGDDVIIRVRAEADQALRTFAKVASTGVAPLAAALVPLAAKTGAASVAVGAFGAAVAGQVSSLSDAAEAQTKYTEAVVKSGRGSKEAAEAQRAVQAVLAGMPDATARASVALSTLKDTFSAWSDDMSAFTMKPVENTFTVLGQVIPQLTPMAAGAADELNRLVTVAGGAVASPGFDALSERFSAFANESLQDAVDGIIHFSRVLSEGQGSGPVREFMEFAEASGPALRETLANVGDAVVTLSQAAADAGPGMLTLVNSGLELVAALPPELVATLMQLALGLKVVTLAGAGAAAVSGGIATLGTRIAALRAASAAAGGGMAGLAAAFGTLGTAAKASIVVAGIAAVVVAFGKLSELGREAPPNVDRLTTSLGELGRTGRASGEAARLFGDDLDGLYESVRAVADPSLADNVQQGLVKVFSLGFADSTPVTEAKDRLDGIDESLTNLVKGGKGEVAAAAFKRLSEEWVAGGGSLSDFKGQMDGYQASLADAAFEQELAAESMGVFGAAAQETSAKLESQKSAADGLRQSILALNDVNRSAYEAQIGFEEALDGLTASFAEHGATLNLDTEAGRANAQAMVDAAKSQDELIASGLAAGESLGSMTKKSSELRAEMLLLATEAFDGNKKKAQEYVNTLLGAPGEIKTLVKLEREEAVAGLEAVQAAIEETPDAKTVTVDTLNGAAIKALEDVGLKTKQLPDGKTQVFTANGKALGSIEAVRRALKALDGQTATTWTYHNVKTTYVNSVVTTTKGSLHDAVGATGGLYTGRGFRYADGGLVSGPGTGTSDDVFAPWLSNGEFVIKKAAVDKYGEKFLQLVNDGQLDMPRFAGGGKVTQAQKDARADLSRSFGISHFGAMAGYQRDPFEKSLGRPDDLGALVSALNELRGQIKAAFSGSKESSLLKSLNSAGKKLIAYEKQLTAVNKKLETARDKLEELRSASAQLASSVKGGILSSADITKRASGDGPVTVASIMGGLTASRDQASAFSGALAKLKKMGLSPALIRQIAEAGIEGGGLETAGALLGASSSEIQSLNSLQSQINKSAGAAGKATADAVYAGSIKAQKDLVHKLDAQQNKLIRSMDKLAGNLEKLLQKALSGKAAGGIVGGAASGGIRSNLTWVGEHGPELLDLAAGSRVWSNPDSRRMAGAAWASMLNEPRLPMSRGPVGSAPVGGDGQPIVIQLRLAERDFGEVWVDVGRKQVRARGGIEATLKPPRGR